MREEIIEILAMINPALDIEDEDINIAESLDSTELDTFISELEDKFDIEIGEDERTEDNFSGIDVLIEMIENLQ